MNSRGSLLAACVLAGSLVGIVVWRGLRPRGTETAVHLVVVRDRSGSSNSGCVAIAGLADRAMSADGVDKRSTLLVLATGDGRTAGEPVELGRFAAFKSRRATEGRKTAVRKERALLARLVRLCEEAGGGTRSPVFLAVRRGLDHLHAAGCRPGNGCRIYVQTDGAENVEPAIRRALSGGRGVGALPAPLENGGVAVVMCGGAETSGPADRPGRPPSARPLHDARRADRMVHVWRRLFTAPEQVTFEPHCPKVDASAAVSDGPRAVASR